MQINSKVIVVTGAANGLGRELTLNLLKRGATVAAVDVNQENLLETEKLAGSLKNNLSLHVLDITQKEEVEKLGDKLYSAYGRVEGVINNAGIIQPFLSVTDLDFEKINKVMNVNFFGTLYFTKTFLPLLLKNNEAFITNVSSMGGVFPFPGQTIYGASKAAIKLLTEGLYAELMGTSVRATVVILGAMATEIAKNSQVEMSEKMKKMQGSVKALSPQKAAELIIGAIEREKRLITVGSDAKLLTTLYKIAPGISVKFIAKYFGSKILGK